MGERSGLSTLTTTVNRGAHFTWSEAPNVLLCREILLVQPFQYKPGTRESGRAWESVATQLNSLEDINPKFNVTQRTVRDRFRLLESGFKRKTNQEERASGISPEITELDVLLEEIVELCKSRNQENDTTVGKKAVAEKEKLTAEEMRRKALETVGETNRRRAAAEGGDPLSKKKRSHGGDTLEYLREKSGEEMELRKKELDLRAAELNAAQKRHDDYVLQQTSLMNVIQQQHEQMFTQLQQQHQQQQQRQEEQQQQMQQMLLSLMNSQQQQQQMILSLIEKKKD